MQPQMIASAPTLNGFAIGILTQRDGYAVVRLDDTMAYLVLGRRATERDARNLANALWKQETGK